MLTPTPPSIVPRVVNAPAVVFATVPASEPATPALVSAAGTQPIAAQPAQSAAMDMGAPVEQAGSSLGNRSLAQAAAAERHGSQAPVTRTLTNQDVQRLNEQTKSGTLGLPPAQAPNSNPAK
jgi:hypothetical protein